jgi:hypothetical protein
MTHTLATLSDAPPVFKFFRPTEWEFVTSGGGELTIGIWKLLFAGGTIGAFYVRRPESPIYRLPYAGTVGGAGVGISTAGPVGVSVSLPWAPGGGFRNYRNPIRSTELALDDFAGTFVALSGAGGIFGAGSGTAVIFGAPAWLVTSALNGADVAVVVMASAGAGLLWGTAATNGLGVSLELVRGEIIGNELAATGETR